MAQQSTYIGVMSHQIQQTQREDGGKANSQGTQSTNMGASNILPQECINRILYKK